MTESTLKKLTREFMQNSQYDRAASLVQEELEIGFKAEFKEHGFHFEDDKNKRDIYTITLSRGTRSYSFQFGQSIFHSGKWIGHKILCNNKFGRYLFSDQALKDFPELSGKIGKEYHEIKRNPNFQEPTIYSVLACLTKHDPGDLQEFCDEFGYDIDSKKAEKVYNAVLDEFNNMKMLFSDNELEILQEIC